MTLDAHLSDNHESPRNMANDNARRTFGATSIVNLIKERRSRDALYHSADYWDARATARTGLARSIWPSNHFNEVWDARQRSLLQRLLGDVTGRRLVDVGCGTGRMSRVFAEWGAAEVVGLDFSPGTVEAAREETSQLLADRPKIQSRVRFDVGDVVAGLDHAGVASFDDAVVLGCFSVACRDLDQLERAMKNVARLVKPGGRVVIAEPIHRSPLLRRVLDLGLEEWIGTANRAGMSLLAATRMGFVPVRLFCSVRDLPRGLLRPIFDAGESLLDHAPYLAPLSDYKLLMFRVDGAR